MADDSTYRLAILAIVATFAPIALQYRVRSATAEKLDRWQEGAFILFGLRLGAVPMFVAGLVWLLDPQAMAWSSIAVPAWSRWLGIAAMAASGLLVVWAFHNLGKNLTDTVVTRRDHTLVTTGPYRFVRHPFYLAIALGVLGGSAATANWFILAAGVVPLAFLAARTRVEEEMLLRRFGDEYQDYMRRVGRFIPRLKA